MRLFLPSRFFATITIVLVGLVSSQAQTAFLGHSAGPKMFAPGIVSTEDDEINGAISPDGNDYYFAKVLQYTTFPRMGVLCVSHRQGTRWSEPEILPFSGVYQYDTLPRLSPDGTRLYFTSSRLPTGKKARVLRIWVASKTGSGWSEPEPLPAPINTDDSWNWGASLTRDGAIYFTSDRGEQLHPQLYRAKFVDGKYTKPEKLAQEISSEFNDYDAFVSADESLLVFSSSGNGPPENKNRPTTIDGHGFQYPRGDLYISRNNGGRWTEAKHLGPSINSEAEESSPSITADGKYLFYSSDRSPYTVPTSHSLKYQEIERNLHSPFNGHGNVYYIPVDQIGDAR